MILGEAHLRRVLATYANYYNELRTQRSLITDAPLHRIVERVGTLSSQPISAAFTINMPNLNFGTHGLTCIESCGTARMRRSGSRFVEAADLFDRAIDCGLRLAGLPE